MHKLLIVDDDEHLLESLRVVFQGIYEVSTACSAEQAALHLAGTPVDVLLLDVRLPGMDGLEFLKRVRVEYPGLPVVMISGGISIRPVMQALELGARDYIRKPFDVDELRLVVGRCLHLVELQDRLEILEEEVATRPFVADPERKPMKEAVEEFERALIKRALARAGGVQTRAAEVLGTTRRILRYRMEKLRIVEEQEKSA